MLCSFFQGLCKLCTDCLLLQTSDIEAFWDWLPLGASFGKYPDVHLGDDEPMVRPIVCATHGLGYSEMVI